MRSRSPIVDFIRSFDDLPKEAKTRGQQRLMKQHQSPYEFALACSEAIGEISVEEARAAVEKYKLEWLSAK